MKITGIKKNIKIIKPLLLLAFIVGLVFSYPGWWVLIKSWLRELGQAHMDLVNSGSNVSYDLLTRHRLFWERGSQISILDPWLKDGILFGIGLPGLIILGVFIGNYCFSHGKRTKARSLIDSYVKKARLRLNVFNLEEVVYRLLFMAMILLLPQLLIAPYFEFPQEVIYSLLWAFMMYCMVMEVRFLHRNWYSRARTVRLVDDRLKLKDGLVTWTQSRGEDNNYLQDYLDSQIIERINANPLKQVFPYRAPRFVQKRLFRQLAVINLVAVFLNLAVPSLVSSYVGTPALVVSGQPPQAEIIALQRQLREEGREISELASQLENLTQDKGDGLIFAAVGLKKLGEELAVLSISARDLLNAEKNIDAEDYKKIPAGETSESQRRNADKTKAVEVKYNFDSNIIPIGEALKLVKNEDVKNNNSFYERISEQLKKFLPAAVKHDRNIRQTLDELRNPQQPASKGARPPTSSPGKQHTTREAPVAPPSPVIQRTSTVVQGKELEKILDELRKWQEELQESMSRIRQSENSDQKILEGGSGQNPRQATYIKGNKQQRDRSDDGRWKIRVGGQQRDPHHDKVINLNPENKKPIRPPESGSERAAVVAQVQLRGFSPQQVASRIDSAQGHLSIGKKTLGLGVSKPGQRQFSEGQQLTGRGTHKRGGKNYQGKAQYKGDVNGDKALSRGQNKGNGAGKGTVSRGRRVQSGNNRQSAARRDSENRGRKDSSGTMGQDNRLNGSEDKSDQRQSGNGWQLASRQDNNGLKRYDSKKGATRQRNKAKGNDSNNSQRLREGPGDKQLGDSNNIQGDNGRQSAMNGLYNDKLGRGFRTANAGGADSSGAFDVKTAKLMLKEGAGLNPVQRMVLEESLSRLREDQMENKRQLQAPVVPKILEPISATLGGRVVRRNSAAQKMLRQNSEYMRNNANQRNKQGVSEQPGLQLENKIFQKSVADIKAYQSKKTLGTQSAVDGGEGQRQLQNQTASRLKNKSGQKAFDEFSLYQDKEKNNAQYSVLQAGNNIIDTQANGYQEKKKRAAGENSEVEGDLDLKDSEVFSGIKTALRDDGVKGESKEALLRALAFMRNKQQGGRINYQNYQAPDRQGRIPASDLKLRREKENSASDIRESKAKNKRKSQKPDLSADIKKIKSLLREETEKLNPISRKALRGSLALMRRELRNKNNSQLEMPVNAQLSVDRETRQSGKNKAAKLQSAYRRLEQANIQFADLAKELTSPNKDLLKADQTLLLQAQKKELQILSKQLAGLGDISPKGNELSRQVQDVANQLDKKAAVREELEKQAEHSENLYQKLKTLRQQVLAKIDESLEQVAFVREDKKEDSSSDNTEGRQDSRFQSGSKKFEETENPARPSFLNKSLRMDSDEHAGEGAQNNPSRKRGLSSNNSGGSEFTANIDDARQLMGSGLAKGLEREFSSGVKNLEREDLWGNPYPGRSGLSRNEIFDKVVRRLMEVRQNLLGAGVENSLSGTVSPVSRKQIKVKARQAATQPDNLPPRWKLTSAELTNPFKRKGLVKPEAKMPSDTLVSFVSERKNVVWGEVPLPEESSPPDNFTTTVPTVPRTKASLSSAASRVDSIDRQEIPLQYQSIIKQLFKSAN